MMTISSSREPGPLIKQICALPNLTAAWRAVRGNIAVRRRPHSCGVDEVSVAAFEQQWEANLAELSTAMLEGRYRPLPPRRIALRKPGGGQRTIGVLAVRDRVAQRAAHQILEPVFDAQFLDCSYGFRTGRSVEDAIHRVLCYRQAGCDWVYDADIAACFDTLDHRLLMGFVSETVHERPVLRLIEGWLESGVLETDAQVYYHVPGRWERMVDGLIARLRPSTGRSPLLGWPEAGDTADAALLEDSAWDVDWRRRELLRSLGTDALLTGLVAARPTLKRVIPGLRRLMRRKGLVWGAAGLVGAGALTATWLLFRQLAPRNRGALQGGAISPLLANVYLHRFDRAMTDADENLVRFADDLVLCCPSRAAAERAGERAARELARLRLRLNPDKSRVVSFERGFRFLGHRFKNDR